MPSSDPWMALEIIYWLDAKIELAGTCFCHPGMLHSLSGKAAGRNEVH